MPTGHNQLILMDCFWHMPTGLKLLYFRYMPTRLNDLLSYFSTSGTCQLDLMNFLISECECSLSVTRGFLHEASFDQNIGIQTIALGLQCFRPGTNAQVQFFSGGRGVCALKRASPITTRGFAGSSAGLPQQQAMIGAIGDVAPWIGSSCFKLFQLL